MSRKNKAVKSDAVAPRADGWGNVFTGVGMANRDKREFSQVQADRTFNNYLELEALFHSNDLANRICTLPIDEMTKHGWDLKLGDEDLEKKVSQALQELAFRSKLNEACIWGRLFGGGIVLLGADDGQDPKMPLDLNRLKAVRFLTVLDRFDVRIVSTYADPLSPDFGTPELFEIQQSNIGINQFGISPNKQVQVGAQFHASRCLIFEGVKTSRRKRFRSNMGWSDSVFVKLFKILRDYDATWDSVGILIQDFAQAVFKMKGLAEAFASNGEKVVSDRLLSMDMSRSVLRSVVLDAEAEDYERKATPMTGLPEILDRFLHRMSAASEIPITLLFGMSPGGLNATGDSDTRNWYDNVKAKQESILRPQLEKFFKIFLAAKESPTKGRPPEDWSFEFCSLMQMSDKDKADLRKTQAETDQIYMNAQVVTPEEIANSRFGGDEYSIETTIDQGARDMLASVQSNQPPQAQQENLPEGE